AKLVEALDELEIPPQRQRGVFAHRMKGGEKDAEIEAIDGHTRSPFRESGQLCLAGAGDAIADPSRADPRAEATRSRFSRSARPSRRFPQATEWPPRPHSRGHRSRGRPNRAPPR